MTRWLSDEEIDTTGRVWKDCPRVRDLCVQAKEANRLRRGLEHVMLDIEGTPFLQATGVLPFLRELLED